MYIALLQSHSVINISIFYKNVNILVSADPLCILLTKTEGSFFISISQKNKKTVVIFYNMWYNISDKVHKRGAEVWQI